MSKKKKKYTTPLGYQLELIKKELPDEYEKLMELLKTTKKQEVMNNLELLYIIPLSVIVLFFMIVIGVTLISMVTGDIGIVETMLKMLFYKKNRKG